MSDLDVLTYPHEKLRQETLEITCFDDALEKFTADLLNTMYNEQGCGLAAPQVGSHHRLFVMDTSRDLTNPICMVNPEIIHQEGVVASNEGCLSFPNIYIQVKRAKQITVRYQTVAGQPEETSLEGLAAICVQHELDHLNGILFVDLLSKLKKERALKKLAKYSNT